MSTATKRACDACHRRKVRCNGANPCQNCQQASLTCTYDKPPQKKGPKGSRAKVISELRKNQAAPGPSSGGSGINLESPLSSPTLVRHRELLSPELIDLCIPAFFEKLYPTLPIIHRQWIFDKVKEVPKSPEAYCVVGSICAFMTIQPNMTLPFTPPPFHRVTPMQHAANIGLKIVEDVKRVRNTIEDYAEHPTTAFILTSFFLSASLFGLEKHSAAWFYLQEAILFGRMLRIHDEKTYVNKPHSSNPEETMNRRLYWILVVSERAQALQKHRDLTFHETIAFPRPEEDPLEVVAIPGLACLFNLFRIVDDKVSEIWNNLRTSTAISWPANTSAWLAAMHRQLTDAIPEDIDITEAQEVDVRTSQMWLRSVVWQLSTASGCLSSNAADYYMTFAYPIEIARELVELTNRVSQASMEVHGIGLVEKLFDISYTLIDVMAVVPIDSVTFEVGPKDHLSHMLQLISTLRGGETRYVTLIQAKINDTLPSLASSLTMPMTPASQHSFTERSGPSAASSPYGSPPSIGLSTTGLGPTSAGPGGRYPLIQSEMSPTDSPMSATMPLGQMSLSASSPSSDTQMSMSTVDSSGSYAMRFPGPHDSPSATGL